MSLKIKSVE